MSYLHSSFFTLALIMGFAVLSPDAWSDPRRLPSIEHKAPTPEQMQKLNAPSQLFGAPSTNPPLEPPTDIPWLTGPLLCPSAHVIPTGHINIEPYEFVTTVYGVYNKKWNTSSVPKFYAVQTSIPFQWGFAKRFDVQFTPQFVWKHTDGASHWDYGDMSVAVDYQIVFDRPDRWYPAVRVTASLNMPFGRYRHLKLNKKGTDIGGSGAWEPGFALSLSRLFTFSAPHFLATRFFFGYTPTVHVYVSDLNAYGGAKGTRGKVYPGNSFTGIVGLEYTLTQRWALALDIEYIHSNKTRFSGRTLAPVGSPSSEQLSFAPAFEYNWSAYVGIIAGCWFTAAGRNAPKFASGVVAVNIYH